jgi:hypothetical protein
LALRAGLDLSREQGDGLLRRNKQVACLDLRNGSAELPRDGRSLFALGKLALHHL